MQQFEDILFAGNDVSMATGVIAVKLANENSQRMVGVAYTDAMLRKLGVCQFVDNEQLSNLEVNTFKPFDLLGDLYSFSLNKQILYN